MDQVHIEREDLADRRRWEKTLLSLGENPAPADHRR
jgi:hypothetical protein